MVMLSPKQRDFLNDPARFKLARCTRRAGKTMSLAVDFILECIGTPNTPCLYLGLTRESAKEAIWPILVTLLEAHKISHEAVASGPRINFPNGSYIQILGADAQNARSRIRGRKFKKVAVDETAFFANDSDQLIYDLLPTLADLSGSLLLTSSPGKSLHGFFYEADEGSLKDNWSRHSWSLLDNPLFMGPASDPQFKTRGEEELHSICNMQFGGDWNHPDFQREYLGKWVISANSLVYPATEKNEQGESLAMIDPQYAFGVKFTPEASYAAVVVLKYSEYSRVAVFDEVRILNEPTVPAFAALLQQMVQDYRPTAILGHEGKLGRVTTIEMSSRYGLHIQPSNIIDKSFYQRVFAGDLLTGDIQVNKVKANILLQEWKRLVKNEYGEETAGPPNHAADAALSVYRRIYSSFLKSAVGKETEEQKMLRHVQEQYEREQEEEKDWL